MTAKTFRHQNLKSLKVVHRTLAEISRLTGVSVGYLSQLHTGDKRGMGAKTAREIEIGLNLTEGWMDLPHDDFADAYELAQIEAIVRLGDPAGRPRLLRQMRALAEAALETETPRR